MAYKRRKKRISLRIIAVVAMIAILICTVIVSRILLTNDYSNYLIEQGFYPIEPVMEVSGYEASDTEYSFLKSYNRKNIKIIFDFEREICYKNEYYFDLSDEHIMFNDKYYLRSEVLESVLNCSLSMENGNIQSEEVNYIGDDWVENFVPLVAHAGGAVREKSVPKGYFTDGICTNSMEALIQNYNLGHRVFEFDFCLTSDNELAAVHDWQRFGLDEAITAEEWNIFSGVDNEKKWNYKTMLIGDILDQMLINKDMFLVTDTKSYELTDEETLIQFQIIYDEACERDPELLNRIIPQIYDEEMYDLLCQVYEYSSFIYTLYASDRSADDVVRFASDESNNICVVTVPDGNDRLEEGLAEKLKDNNIKLYVHTVDNYTTFASNNPKGIDGFYTNMLLPKDYETYMRLD